MMSQLCMIKAKDLAKILVEAVVRVSFSTVKQVLYKHGLEGY